MNTVRAETALCAFPAVFLQVIVSIIIDTTGGHDLAGRCSLVS